MYKREGIGDAGVVRGEKKRKVGEEEQGGEEKIESIPADDEIAVRIEDCF